MKSQLSLSYQLFGETSVIKFKFGEEYVSLFLGGKDIFAFNLGNSFRVLVHH